MASPASFFENLGRDKFILIVVGIVIVMIGAVMAILFLSPGMSSTTSLEDSSPYRDAIFDPSGVKKSDSDVIEVNNEYIPWPDKLSDIEENYIYGTNWRFPDTDQDGMEDGWEALYSRPNPITERLTIDPNTWDSFENPDGDGFDYNNNGLIDTEEELFNLREYCGGAIWDYENGTFDIEDPVFGGLTPSSTSENPDGDWAEIGRLGGFHLYDDPSDGIVGDRTNQDPDKFDDYMRYNPYLPSEFKPVTTNPSLWDTDLDGMDDGWELHYQRELADRFFEEGETNVWIGTIDDLLQANKEKKMDILKVSKAVSGASEDKELEWKEGLIDPLNPNDAVYDMDVRIGYTIEGGQRTPVNIHYGDSLTNLQEYQNHTSPLDWDTDGDSHFNTIKGQIYILSDFIELNINFTRSAVDWNNDGVLDYRTCPYKEDSDGDGMKDGWELDSGLDPLNSTDRFKDLDNDGLPNYLENAFPNKDNLWFQTDPLNRDTDGDGMWDGWEAYNARIIEQTEANSIPEDLEDKISDGLKTRFTVSPMIEDDLEDNDGWWNVTSSGQTVYRRIPDGLTNYEEFTGTKYYPVSTNPNEPDTDGDGLKDGEELKQGFVGELIGENYFTNPQFAAIYYTNATLADSDNDFGGSSEIRQVGNTSRSLDDWEETKGRTKYLLPPNGFDDDLDGIVDEPEGEYLLFDPTNATNPDTDLDGWMDVDELFGIDTTLIWDYSPYGVLRTDPHKKDTDNDLMSDYDELNLIPNYREWITDPTNPDTDQDGMEDGRENEVDFFPLIDYDRTDNWDANGDGDYSDEELGDIWSTDDRTDPTKRDTDGDGIPDGWEYTKGKIIKSDATRKIIEWYDFEYDTNYWNQLPEGGHFWVVNPLIDSDIYDDPDQDDLTNWQEYENGTHPLLWDTDGDGMPDGWELKDENRGSPVWNKEKLAWTYVLNPLSPRDNPDWCLDSDHDGYYFDIWTEVSSGTYEYVTYYFPWINLYEYQYGWDTDNDGINEITTSPAPWIVESGDRGGHDSDNDGMSDGWEVWVTDNVGNLSDPQPFEDNDTLPKGWEDIFNGSAWNRPLCYPYEMARNGSWDPFATTEDMAREGARVFIPAGLGPGSINPGNYIGSLWSERKDSNMDGVMDPNANADQDRDNNYIEYRGHTDPTNPNVYTGLGNIPAVSVGPSRNHIERVVDCPRTDDVSTQPVEVVDGSEMLQKELTEQLEIKRSIPNERIMEPQKKD